MNWIIALFNILIAITFLVLGISKLVGLVFPARETRRRGSKSNPSEFDSMKLRRASYIAEVAKAVSYILFAAGLAVDDVLPPSLSFDTLKLLLFGLGIICGIGGYLIDHSLQRKTSPQGGANRINNTPKQIMLRDVTADPESIAQAHQMPKLRAGLLRLGFTPVCFLEASATLDKKREVSEVSEVLTSPDKTTFAELDIFFGNHVITMRTILDDSSVIETTLLKPEREKDWLFGNWRD